MGRFSKILNKVTDNTVQPGDETAPANNIRNMLADNVNPLLDEYINPVLPEAIQMGIPKMTVADDKNYYKNLPEQMAGATMGSLKEIPSARFGKILNIVDDAPQALGKVIQKAEQQGGLGKTITKPSMADLVDDTSKFGQKKQLDAAGIKSKFDEIYGTEALTRKADVKKGLKSPDAYDSWKQEMYNAIRRGENG